MEQLQKFWDTFSNKYSAFSNCPAAMQIQLWNMLKVHQADSMIDCGCGPGFLLPHLLITKKKGCKLIACDLSTEMVKLSSKRIEELIKKAQASEYGDLSHVQSDPSEDKDIYDFPQINFTIRQGNAENLQFCQAEQFDVYSSNLVLHLTVDAEKMLQEAQRVLKPKGKIGCTVWGRRENSDIMTVLYKVLNKLNIEYKPNGRSPFHMNDRDELIKLFEKNGYEKVISWYSQVPFTLITEEDLSIIIDNPGHKDFWASLTKEQFDQVITQLNEEIRQKIEIDKQPFFLEGLFVIAIKK